MNYLMTKPDASSRPGFSRVGFSLALLPLLASVALAQEAAPAPAASDQDVIALSPFVVSTARDYGYRASNSIAGTRSNTPIKDIAMNIQVFTADVNEDLVVNDQTVLERYQAAVTNGGADVQSDNNIQQAYNAFLFRGFVQNWGLRDGIREYDPVDAQGLARVEVVKGPAGALYGLSYAGGVMNSVTKQVDMNRSFASTRLSVDDQGEYRATADVNCIGKIGDQKFGVRVNLANTASKDHRAHSQGQIKFNQTNIAWEPFKSTSLALLVENSYRGKPNDLGYYTRPGGSVAATASSELGIGVSVPLQIDHPDIPWTWNWADAGKNDRQLETFLVRGTITQKFGDNFFITAYLQANRHNQPDSVGWDDAGNSQNGAGWDCTTWAPSYPASGWLNPDSPTEMIRKIYHYRNWSNNVHAMGVNAVYKLDMSSVKNTITVGAAHWEERFISRKFLELPNDEGTMTFFDLPVAANIDTSVPITAPPAEYQPVVGGGAKEHSQNTYEYINWQISALDDRLKVNAAVNHTHILNTQFANDASVNWSEGGNRADVQKDSPMFGIVFDITKEISIFAVHSTSLFPTTDKNSFFVQMPPEVGKANEVGFKLALLDGKINGTISYYKINKTGGGVRDPAADNRTTQQWDGMNTAQREATFGVTEEQATTGAAAYRQTIAGDLVPAELESKGFEADMVFQPTKELQLVLSYANNSEESTKGTTQGYENGGHIKQQWSLLTKYTFVQGAAKGLAIGVGMQAAGKAYQGYLTDGSGNVVKQYNPSTFYLEAFASYEFKMLGCTNLIQLNAKNLTQVDDLIGWMPTGSAATVATERYKVPTYAKFTLTWGLDF